MSPFNVRFQTFTKSITSCAILFFCFVVFQAISFANPANLQFQNRQIESSHHTRGKPLLMLDLFDALSIVYMVLLPSCSFVTLRIGYIIRQTISFQAEAEKVIV